MSQNVADAPDLRPWNFGAKALDVLRDPPARFGYDLDRPLACQFQERVGLVIGKCFAGDGRLDRTDRQVDVVEEVANVSRYQKTRSAEAMMRSRRMGCRLSRVVTSTGIDRSSSRNSLIPTRSNALKRERGS